MFNINTTLKMIDWVENRHQLVLPLALLKPLNCSTVGVGFRSVGQAEDIQTKPLLIHDFNRVVHWLYKASTEAKPGSIPGATNVVRIPPVHSQQRGGLHTARRRPRFLGCGETDCSHSMWQTKLQPLDNYCSLSCSLPTIPCRRAADYPHLCFLFSLHFIVGQDREPVKEVSNMVRSKEQTRNLVDGAAPHNIVTRDKFENLPKIYTNLE